ncbi:MAG: PCMD domain-containing protein [Muribaculaceae bacterium]|nr:PCMD domain-containing protein [Muribaculaceae bacterium]
MRFLFLLKSLILVLGVLPGCISTHALRLEPIKYGDFSSWIKRDISESAVLGGNHKTVYEIGPARTITGNKPYTNLGGSPWATSNVYAKVSGVVKASNAVTPHKRGSNTCAKMQAIMEHVKVLGLINMDVMVAGTIFLGQINEPITSTKTPFGKMEMGIPYTKRPKALVFDYQVDMPAANTRVKSTGLGKKKILQGRDNAEVYVLLQKRWEDEKGNLYAHRVGTGRERYSKAVPWTAGHELPIHYGDITKQHFYKPWMGLLSGEKAYYARNSKGKLVPVQEVGWAPADAVPTHVLVMASSSCGEPFIGTEGLTLYIDNVAFGF